MSVCDQDWDRIYREGDTIWFPHEAVVIFLSRCLKKRVSIDTFKEIRPARRVLDVGCGNGATCLAFAKYGYEVHGLDISPTAIKIAEELFERENAKGIFTVGSCDSINYPDDVFDVVVSYGVLDHVPMVTCKASVRETARVLKPGGLFFLTLISTADCDYRVGTEIEVNTFVIPTGPEAKLIQHYFTFDEVCDGLQGLFRIDRVELIETRFGEKLIDRHSRWVLYLTKE